jgi:very-short-patch-repair endonuclease
LRRKIIPYNSNLKPFARKLRNESTFGEILLWQQLNNKKFYGLDFHRQKPLLNYIVDFYCYDLELVIEIDGRYHNDELQYNQDKIRDNQLQEYGLTVIRFSESEIKGDIFNAMRRLEDYYLRRLEEQAVTPTPEI